MRLPDHQALRICGRVEAHEQKVLGRSKDSQPDASPHSHAQATGLDVIRPAGRDRQASRRQPGPAQTTAMIGRCVLVGSFVQCGSKRDFSISRWRSPLSGWRRTIAAPCVGATFQAGARFGSGFTV